MAYATAQQFVDKYGADVAVALLASLEKGASRDLQILQDLLDGMAPQDASEEALQAGIDRVVRVLDEQSDLADGYLVRRADLPLDQATIDASPLAGYVCDLARFELAKRPGTRTKDIEADHARAIAWLRDVAAGRAALPGLPAQTATRTGRFVLKSGVDADEQESNCARAVPDWMSGCR